MSKKSKSKKNDRLMKRKAGKDKLEKEKSKSTLSLEIENENEIKNAQNDIPPKMKKCVHIKKMVKINTIKIAFTKLKSLNICNDCKQGKSEFKDIFMCLSCAKFFCGNHDENHTENHFKTENHCIFMNTKSKAFFCFLCEDEIFYGNNRNLILTDIKSFIDNYEKKKKMKEVEEIRKERYNENAKKTAIYPGLRNLGNTCFFNSVMQCLTYTKPFEDIVNDRLDVEEGSLTEAFIQFLKSMHGKLKASEEKQNKEIKFSQEVFTPRELFNEIIAKWSQYKGYHQQDSHELLRHLLDGIRDEQIKALKEKGEEKKKTFIDEIFGGKLVNCIICDTCKMINYTYEPFFDLSLSIIENSNLKKKLDNEDEDIIGPDKSNIEEKLKNEKYPLINDEKNKKNIECILNDIIVEKKENEEILSIRDCIKQFMDIDTLEGNEACVCDNCTKIRYGDQNIKSNKKIKKIKINIKNKGNKLSIKGHQEDDEDYISIKYYCSLNGIKEDKENLDNFNNNNDNDETENSNIEEENEVENEEEEIEDEEEEKKKIVYRRIKKRYFIDEAPKILVLNLKRFTQIGFYGRVKKSEKFVDFQQFLKLAPYLSPIKYDKTSQPFYRLYGVVVHSGFSVQSGHYFAYISREMGDWFYASDSCIKPSDWDEVKKSRPYLLFYERIK